MPEKRSRPFKIRHIADPEQSKPATEKRKKEPLERNWASESREEQGKEKIAA